MKNTARGSLPFTSFTRPLFLLSFLVAFMVADLAYANVTVILVRVLRGGISQPAAHVRVPGTCSDSPCEATPSAVELGVAQFPCDAAGVATVVLTCGADPPCPDKDCLFLLSAELWDAPNEKWLVHQWFETVLCDDPKGQPQDTIDVEVADVPLGAACVCWQCIDDLTEEVVDSLGFGTHQGPGTTCDGTTCPGVPALTHLGLAVLLALLIASAVYVIYQRRRGVVRT